MLEISIILVITSGVDKMILPNSRRLKYGRVDISFTHLESWH